MKLIVSVLELVDAGVFNEFCLRYAFDESELLKHPDYNVTIEREDAERWGIAGFSLEKTE